VGAGGLWQIVRESLACNLSMSMNKRLVIVILITLTLIVLGGVVVYVTFFSDDTDSEEGASSERGGLFPFLGRDREQEQGGDGDTATSSDGNDLSFTALQSTQGAVLKQLWNEPVAGATFWLDEAGSSTVRLVERATGHIYQIHIDTEQVKRLSNTTIPKIQEVYWASSDRLVMRYLRDEEDIIETFAATIVLPDPEATSTEEMVGELRGQFLPTNIIELAVQSGGTLFYTTEGGGTLRGTVSAFDGTDARVVFSSKVRDWLPEWVNNSTIALTNKSAGSIPGNLVFLNTATGTLLPVLNNIIGLTTHVGSGGLLYATFDNIPVLSMYDIDSKKTTSSLSISTLTEKCVWEIDGLGVVCAVPRRFSGQVLPDAWYQGVEHFDDEIYKLDLKTFATNKVLDPRVFTSEPLDIVDLSIDESENLILFRNKTDHTLWLFRALESEEESTDIEIPES